MTNGKVALVTGAYPAESGALAQSSLERLATR